MLESVPVGMGGVGARDDGGDGVVGAVTGEALRRGRGVVGASAVVTAPFRELDWHDDAVEMPGCVSLLDRLDEPLVAEVMIIVLFKRTRSQ